MSDQTAGDTERLRAAVTTGAAPGCYGHEGPIKKAVVAVDGSVSCPMCAEYIRSLHADTDRPSGDAE